MYGGMPYDALLSKFEETDPLFIDDVRNHREPQWDESDYNDYVRSELIDYTPDAPFLESDHARRDPGVSRSLLNLRYKGSRGSNTEGPRHPDLFYGFTGNDPRGTENNPRFDQFRAQIMARKGDLTARMVDSAENQIAESPWTGQSISYAMKEMFKRVKSQTKIFTPQRESMMHGSNISTRRRQLTTIADESLPGPRFANSDYNPANDEQTDGIRRIDRSASDRAPWYNTTGDMMLGVQQYGQTRSGKKVVGAHTQGGGKLDAIKGDQDWAESSIGASTNRQVLAATMAAATRYHAAASSTTQDQDPGSSYEGMIAGGGIVPGRDVAVIYRQLTEEQTRRPETEIQDDEGGTIMGAGIVPSAHPEYATRAGQIHTTDNDHLTNVESIIAGLREGTAAGRRRIAGAIIADGARHEVADESVPRRGIVPTTDMGRISRQTEMPLLRAAAAEDLVVHTYQRAALTRPKHLAVNASYDAATWQASREALPASRQLAHDAWRSSTKSQGTIDGTGREFGSADDSHGFGTSGLVGTKYLRSNDSGDMTDELTDRF